MEQLGAVRRIGIAAALALVVAAGSFVLILRASNPGPEPQGQNWWLMCWLTMAAAYGAAGVALLAALSRRMLAVCFLVVGGAALVTAVAVQYRGYVVANGGRPPWPRQATADEWARPLMAGVLAVFVPWSLLPASWRGWRHHRLVSTAAGLTLAAVVILRLLDGSEVLVRICWWALCLAATAATAALAVHWWRHDRRSGDPLPAWLLAGTIVGWLAVVPDATDLASWRLPGRDVVTAMLFVATVPLLVAGSVIELMRRTPGGRERTLHRVVEWALLSAGIVVIYTALVAGLGQLVGGSGPTWFLVAATGIIALALEPFRQRVRHLTDRLVYGARDDPLTLVQRVVGHVGGTDDPLPSLVRSLQRELRVDAVAIDLWTDGDWQRVASSGPATPREREVVLSHRDEVVGRLVVGWEHGPSLRARDEHVLVALSGPLTLAVRWVRLAGDLRRSNLAVVVTREEERRRLRRDLHDGIGPALTGISLGMRAALRRLGRSSPVDGSAQELLERLADEVDGVVGELRQIVRDLRPTALDQFGLVGAVAEFARRFDDDLEIHLTLPAEPVVLPAAVEVATYRIVTEAVTNVVRHADAHTCWLSITASGPRRSGPDHVGRDGVGPNGVGMVSIDVVDDGLGLDGERPGVGLTAMHERAAELGGCVELRPLRPHGTHVHVELPAGVA